MIPSDLPTLAQMLLNAAASKNWFLLLSLALVGVVMLVRNQFAAKIPWLATTAGSAVVGLVLSCATAVALAFMVPGTPLAGAAAVGIAVAALKVAFAAAVKDQFLQKVLPWLLIKVGLKAKPVAASAADAAVAGAAAVVAKPAAGVAGIVKVDDK